MAKPHRLRAAPRLCFLGVALLALGGCGSSANHSSVAGPPPVLVSIGAGLKGPAGLWASVYSQGPPTTAAFAFDSQGRLWLTAAGWKTTLTTAYT